MIATVNEVYDILQAMKNQQENITGRICRICPSARRPFVRHNPTCNLATLNKYAYQYDDIGNRIESLDLGTNRTYVANALNQYTQISNLCDSASLREEFIPVFDLDGNQTLIKTATGVWQVTYNGENRPVLWTCGATNIVMSFDRMGRRVEYLETVADSTGGPGSVPATTNAHHRFVYDGYLCIQRLNAASNNAVDLAFGWDPTEPIATRPLWMQRVSGTYNFFYFHDGNKNVSDLVSYQSARGVPAHYEYAPFGAVTAATTNTAFTAFNVAEANPFRFSSEYADDALGVSYYNYRHYNSCNGRWTSRDPINENGIINYYTFGANSSNLFDFLGMKAACAKAGLFDVKELSISLTPQERQFNQRGVEKEAEELLKTLRRMGYDSIGSIASISLSSAGQYIKDIMQIMGFAEYFAKSHKDDDFRAQFLVDKFLHKNFYNRIYRVDGVLKYCLCECENGRLVWSRKPDLEYSDDVDFKYIYDTSDYNSRIEATYKSVQKELIGKLGEVVKNAKGL